MAETQRNQFLFRSPTLHFPNSRMKKLVVGGRPYKCKGLIEQEAGSFGQERGVCFYSEGSYLIAGTAKGKETLDDLQQERHISI